MRSRLGCESILECVRMALEQIKRVAEGLRIRVLALAVVRTASHFCLDEDPSSPRGVLLLSKGVPQTQDCHLLATVEPAVASLRGTMLARMDVIWQ